MAVTRVQMMMGKPTSGENSTSSATQVGLFGHQLRRRDFLQLSGVAAATAALPLSLNARRVVAQSNSSLALRISGNRFIDEAGSTVQLRGSTRSSQVYAARKGKFEDGQWDQASVAAMAAW